MSELRGARGGRRSSPLPDAHVWLPAGRCRLDCVDTGADPDESAAAEADDRERTPYAAPPIELRLSRLEMDGYLRARTSGGFSCGSTPGRLVCAGRVRSGQVRSGVTRARPGQGGQGAAGTLTGTPPAQRARLWSEGGWAVRAHRHVYKQGGWIPRQDVKHQPAETRRERDRER